MTVSFDADVTLTVEMAFGFGALHATPTWTDVSAYVRAFTTDRGRSSVLGQFNAGTAGLTLDNRDGRFDPNNTSSPYSPNVLVGVPIRIRATHSVTTYDVFRGTVEGWPLSYPEKGKDGVVEVPCVDGFKLLALHDLGGNTYVAEDTNARITAVLDDVGWPAAARDLGAGVGSVQAFTPDSTDALTHLLAVAEAEVGAFFIAGDGDATFHNRTQFSGSPASQGTFGQGGGELKYADIGLSYDDDYLWNDVRVTREGGTEQTASDATSITAYGRRVLSKTGQPNADDNQALNAAEWLRDIYKDVRVRVDSLMLQPRSDAAGLWPQALGRELRQAVTVKLDPPGTGTTLNQLCVIEGISHSVSAQSKTWDTTFRLAPLSSRETASYWILGTSLLDTGTILA